MEKITNRKLQSHFGTHARPTIKCIRDTEKKLNIYFIIETETPLARRLPWWS